MWKAKQRAVLLLIPESNLADRNQGRSRFCYSQGRSGIVHYPMYNPLLQFHFTGIGGAGMSGIAEVLFELGFKVSGSDQKLSPLCLRLLERGIPIVEGHRAENLPESSSLLVYSSAIRDDNPELIEARRRGLPVVRRAEVLAELMRLKFGVAVAGSHGKTTTTSMIAAILEAAELDPTVIIGGQVKSIGRNSKLGKGNFLVAESDESDRSFLLLRPTLAVVTNIDSEHMGAYGTMQDLEQSFEHFARSVPFYGLTVFCIDDPRTKRIAEQHIGRKVLYGLGPGAEISADNIVLRNGITSYDVLVEGERLFRVDFPMPGRHLMLNSLAAIAIGLELGVDSLVIRDALNSFEGVERRLETVGVVDGITVISDYGHHPTEIRATLSAVREGWQGDHKLHVIFQPHRYSRTRDCFFEFVEAFDCADSLIITEIYSGSERPIEGVNGEVLAAAIASPEASYVETLAETLPLILRRVNSGDIVLCLGAGSIGAFAPELVAYLQSARSLKRVVGI